MKFSTYVRKWKMRCRADVSPGWKKTQDQMLRDHIVPILRNKNIQRITKDDISNVMDASRVKEHAPSTQVQIYLLLSKLFNDAVEWFELREHSPIKKKFHKPRLISRKAAHMTRLQLIISLEASTEFWFSTAFWMQGLAGLRVSEAQGVRVRHINFFLNKIDVKESFCRKTKKMRCFTKNRSEHSVAMPKMLKDYLEKYIRLYNLGPDDFLCRNQLGDMFSYNAYEKALRSFFKRLRFVGLTSHSLRHTAAYIWRSAGANLRDLQQFLNHDSADSTKKYDHHDDLRLQTIAVEVNKLLKTSC